MGRTTLQLVAIIAFAALVGTVGMTVKAVADGSAGAGAGTGITDRLHQVGQHLHGGGGGHHDGHGGLGELIEQLELRPDQQEQMNRLYDLMRSFHRGDRDSMMKLHDQLVSQFESGGLDALALRGAVDRHVDRMREVGYAASDELVSLTNGLDSRQRGILLDHLTAQLDHAGGH